MCATRNFIEILIDFLLACTMRSSVDIFSSLQFMIVTTQVLPTIIEDSRLVAIGKCEQWCSEFWPQKESKMCKSRLREGEGMATVANVCKSKASLLAD